MDSLSETGLKRARAPCKCDCLMGTRQASRLGCGLCADVDRLALVLRPADPDQNGKRVEKRVNEFILL